VSARRRFGFDSLRITRGALIIAALEIGLTLVWLMSSPSGRDSFLEFVAASPSTVWGHGRVWTLATSPFLEVQFLTILLHVVVLWSFVPTLERFWGTPRFLRFVAVTSVLGTAAGTAMGLLTGKDVPILGLSPFIYASIVAFGIVYARQPVQFFGVLPLTGRQLMYGILGFLVLFIGLEQQWELGVGFAASMIAAALMTSKSGPGQMYRRWRIKRARAHLSVVPAKPSKPRDQWLN
jgi:membrane associated rhomboid family serine protease